jgi:hypothetical protein
MQATVAKGAAPVTQGLTSHSGLGYGCQLEWRRVLPVRHAAGSAVFLREALVVPGSVLRPAARSCEERGRAGDPRHGERGRRPHAGRIRGSPCGVVPGCGNRLLDAAPGVIPFVHLRLLRVFAPRRRKPDLSLAQVPWLRLRTAWEIAWKLFASFCRARACAALIVREDKSDWQSSSFLSVFYKFLLGTWYSRVGYIYSEFCAGLKTVSLTHSHVLIHVC